MNSMLKRDYKDRPDGGFQEAVYVLRQCLLSRPRRSRSRAAKTFWKRIHTDWYGRKLTRKYGPDYKTILDNQD